ncbi:hypothetical protein M2321_001908 [Rhodoblastus acidophilus]|nr:hypothetical protein [Rhodoblastus acidophilus]
MTKLSVDRRGIGGSKSVDCPENTGRHYGRGGFVDPESMLECDGDVSYAEYGYDRAIQDKYLETDTSGNV